MTGLRIGIIGYGTVGRAMHRLFPAAVVTDKYLGPHGDLGGCDLAFIAVPTPWDGERLDMTEVEAAIADCPVEFIVIRSATTPGFADAMAARYGRRIVVQPEYLGETPNHPFARGGEPPFIVLGGAPEDRRRVIDLYAAVYSANVRIRQLSALEAEIVKLSENRAILWKLAQAQELYDACEAAGVDYYAVREAVYGDDPRMTMWWTLVHPDRRGALSKCIPKDVHGWREWAERVGAPADATRAVLDYNGRLLAGREVEST